LLNSLKGHASTYTGTASELLEMSLRKVRADILCKAWKACYFVARGGTSLEAMRVIYYISQQYGLNLDEDERQRQVMISVFVRRFIDDSVGC
jgi:hypothetical protein